MNAADRPIATRARTPLAIARAATLVVALPMLLALAGCSLLLTDEGVVGPPVTASKDAAPTTGDALAPPPASLCSGTDSSVALCDDFDGATRSAAWSKTELKAGTIGTTTDVFTSPSKALLATGAGGNKADLEHAFYEAIFDGYAALPSVATFEVDVMPRVLTSDAAIVIAAIDTRRAGDFWELQLILTQGPSGPTLHLAEDQIVGGNETFTGHNGTRDVALGAWAHVRIEIRGTTQRHVVLTIDGSRVVDEDVGQSVVDGVPDLALGLVWIPAGEGDVAVAFDNAVFKLGGS